MLGFERTAAFFESVAVLEIDILGGALAWTAGREYFSDTYDLVDTLQANVRIGDSTTDQVQVASGIAGDPRFFLDYYWTVNGWDAGTTAAARNHSVMTVFGATNSAGFQAQDVVPFPGIGPTIVWAPGDTRAIQCYHGTMRLRWRTFRLSLTTLGTTVPTTFNFGAYLRVV